MLQGLYKLFYSHFSFLRERVKNKPALLSSLSSLFCGERGRRGGGEDEQDDREVLSLPSCGGGKKVSVVSSFEEGGKREGKGPEE